MCGCLSVHTIVYFLIKPKMKGLQRTLMMMCVATVATAQLSAQIGTRFPSERKVVIDPVTGTELIFLTSTEGKGDSKIYQTHNQWTSDGKWVIFRSNRVPGEAMAVNEDTGVMVQVTEGGYTGMLNVARNSMKLYFMRPDMTPEQKAEQARMQEEMRTRMEAARAQGGQNAQPQMPRMQMPTYGMQIVEVDLAKLFADSEAGTIKDKSAYERICGITDPAIGAGGDMALDGNEKVAYFRIGSDYAAKFPIKEEISKGFGPRGMGAGPSGIGKMNLETGEVGHVVSVHFQVGHIQGNPWQNDEVIFCWETGGKAPQRTWMVNADGTNLRPVYREQETDWVTHEAVISKDELAIAIIGHRPIQPIGQEVEDTTNDWGPSGTKEYATGLAVVNMRTREFTLEGQAANGDNIWHVGGSEDGNWVVGDDFQRNLWLIDRHTKEMILLTAGHKTTAQDHVHPTFKPDGSAIEIQSAMLSEDGRSMNICIVKMPQALLDRYKK